MREVDLHWLGEGISQSEENRGAKDDGDKDPSQRNKGIGGIHPLLVVMMIKMAIMVVKKLVVMIAIMGETAVLREEPMVLVKANEVVVLYHGIQIIMPHRI